MNDEQLATARVTERAGRAIEPLLRSSLHRVFQVVGTGNTDVVDRFQVE
jgi:hypothetical protein